MFVVGLTGGMGSGKSTVARRLAQLGARVIDADVVAREVVAVGEPALAEIADRFGGHLLTDDGALDRAGLAAVVFGDEVALADLNAITHPRIAERIAERLDGLGADLAAQDVVVVDHPLLVETGQAAAFDAVIVVVAPVDVRVDRLAEGRGIDPDDARARMATQADDDERRTAATHVIENDGSLADLEARTDEVWRDLTRRAAAR